MDNRGHEDSEQDYNQLVDFSEMVSLLKNNTRGLTVSDLNENEYRIFLEVSFKFCRYNQREHLRFLKELPQQEIVFFMELLKAFGFLHSDRLLDQFFPLYTQEQKGIALLCLGPMPEAEFRSFTDKPVSYFIKKVETFCEKRNLDLTNVNPYLVYTDNERIHTDNYARATPRRGPKPRPKKPMKVNWVELVITQDTMEYIRHVLPLSNFKEWYGYKQFEELEFEIKDERTVEEKMFTTGAELGGKKMESKLRQREMLLQRIFTYFPNPPKSNS